MLLWNLIYLHPTLKFVFSFVFVWKQKVAEINEIKWRKNCLHILHNCEKAIIFHVTCNAYIFNLKALYMPHQRCNARARLHSCLIQEKTPAIVTGKGWSTSLSSHEAWADLVSQWLPTLQYPSPTPLYSIHECVCLHVGCVCVWVCNHRQPRTYSETPHSDRGQHCKRGRSTICGYVQTVANCLLLHIEVCWKKERK